MNKQAKDFEKGWEEHKAKKWQEIKEIAQDIACSCVDLVESSCVDVPCYVCIARKLKDKNYRKIPENAVVLTDKKDIQQYEWSKLVDKMGVIEFGEKICKETVEKFAFKVNTTINNHKKKVGEDDYVVNARRLIFEVNEIAKEITEGKI